MKKAKLQGVTLHDCRHTFATLMIAAGVNAKALQTFMGHSSITVTLDSYGHLFPGSEGEAAVLLNAYLAEALERGREADPETVAAQNWQLIRFRFPNREAETPKPRPWKPMSVLCRCQEVLAASCESGTKSNM